ncbi:MAG: quinone-dependent dihydroorotate dehydrogenase, partial [Xanthomonadaceae bacterium]|nr:quinone-dependent dihydroorotate dehydrogenase [Xanthomonadaceae bacterium]
MYRWLRPGLFALSPELAHEVAMNSLRLGGCLGLPRLVVGCPAQLQTELFGLNFPNPVGVAAGLDKN